MVQKLKLLLTDPVRAAHPGLLPLLIPFDPQSDDIILHPVDLLVREPAQPRPKMPEHALIGKVLLRHGKKAAQILHKGIQKDALLVVHEHRDLIPAAGFLQRVRIHIHVRGDHGNLPVPVSLRPHKMPDLPRHIFRLGSRISRLMQAYRVLLPLKGTRRIAEQI